VSKKLSEHLSWFKKIVEKNLGKKMCISCLKKNVEKKSSGKILRKKFRKKKLREMRPILGPLNM